MLITTFIGTLTLPFLNTSKKDVRDLFLAAKDLAQPMGSFSNTLLYPPASIVKNCRSHHTTLPLSPERMSAEGGSKSPAMPDSTEPAPGKIEAGFNTTTPRPPTEPVPNAGILSGSSDSAEEPFLASLEYQYAANDDTPLADGVAERQLSKQQGAEADSLGIISTVVDDDDEEEQRRRASTVAMEEALAKAQDFEEAIRRLVDPEGRDSPDSQGMIKLVVGIIEGRAEADQRLKSETVRLKEAREESQSARESATDEMKGQIEAMKKKHEKETTDTRLKNWQERNGLFCSIQMVKNELVAVRGQTTQDRLQHQATLRNTIKTKNQEIKDLERIFREREVNIIASKELIASEERMSKSQVNEKEEKIHLLQDQLHEREEKVKALGNWKQEAESGKKKYQQLCDVRNDRETTLKENHAHIVDRLKLDNKGLNRTIAINEGKIADLERRITGLESGQEVKDLRSKLARVQKQKKKPTSDLQKMEERVRALEQETENQRLTVKDKDGEIERNTRAWATEKTDLVKRSKQKQDASNRELQGKVKRLEDEKADLKRQMEAAAQSAEQRISTQLENHQKAKTQTAVQHQETLREKDQGIQELQRKVEQAQNAEQRTSDQLHSLKQDKTQTAVRHQETLRVRDQRIQDLEHEKNGAGLAVVEEMKAMQMDFNRERGGLQEAMIRAANTEMTLQSQVHDLRSQLQGYTSAAVQSSTPIVHFEPAKRTNESSPLAVEVDEALSLAEEIGEHGLVRGSSECILLKKLNDAKTALLFIKQDMRQPDLDKNDLLYKISEAIFDEGRISQCDLRKRQQLVKQAKSANRKLQRVQRLLSTSLDVEVEAVLEILSSPTSSDTNGRQEEGDPPAAPEHAVEIQPLHEEDMGEAWGFASPAQPEGVSQPPLPGLFQAPSIDQAPVPNLFLQQGAPRPRKPVVSQPPGELKMPKGLTASMRQFAKGFLRTGNVDRAERLLLKEFKQLEKFNVRGLKTYLVELKKQIEVQPLDQMEQPGGWTKAMTDFVEEAFNKGERPETIVHAIRKEMSHMEGVEFYVQKLKQEHDKLAPAPAGRATGMTENVQKPKQEHDKLAPAPAGRATGMTENVQILLMFPYNLLQLLDLLSLYRTPSIILVYFGTKAFFRRC